jgi:hypothetical protein
MSQKKKNQEGPQERQEFAIGTLIYDDNGLPFETEEAAIKFRTDKHFDSVTVVPKQLKKDAWVLQSVHAPEEYWWVRFNAKAKPTDTDDVQLSVEGETIVIRREHQVCIPQRFLECADHARYPHFQQLPNKPRKIVAWIMTYPYQRIKQGTREEFETMLRTGTKKVLADIKRHGFDLEPEDIEEME